MTKIKYQSYSQKDFFAYIPTLSFVNYEESDMYYDRKQISFYWFRWVFILEFGGQVQDLWEGME